MRLKSILTLVIVFFTFLTFRIYHSEFSGNKPIMVTSWDALGYYIYLPSAIIYKDVSKLEWFEKIDEKYKVSGGKIYQWTQAENGSFVSKYFGGVALLEFPFFISAHLVAPVLGYPADGFSKPYQYAISIAAIFYAQLGIFFLLKILVYYFKERVAVFTVLLILGATNLIQYVSVTSGMSHVYIFFLYALAIYSTHKWHLSPSKFHACLTGLVMGLAVLCRPTEMLIVLIPLLWDINSKESIKEKVQKIKAHKSHVWLSAFFALIGVLPQLIYWKVTSGQWIFNVGSKWVFLNPNFRVLFGWENGWFIYTPVTILFILGFFYLKNYPFRKSVIFFSILNIWVVIAWFDWKYGATYSTRALVQSYPVLALAMAGFISHMDKKIPTLIIYGVSILLIVVNVFQLFQYNKTILHYRDMNRLYYSRIFLNPNPGPLDMSFLDNQEIIPMKDVTDSNMVYNFDGIREKSEVQGETNLLFEEKTIRTNAYKEGRYWWKIKVGLTVEDGAYNSMINLQFNCGDSIKPIKIRIMNPIFKSDTLNKYEFHTELPKCPDLMNGVLYISGSSNLKGSISSLTITEFMSFP